jgi:hypothetical protein
MSHVYRNYSGRTEGKFHFDRVDMNGRVISKWVKKHKVSKEILHLSGS